MLFRSVIDKGVQHSLLVGEILEKIKQEKAADSKEDADGAAAIEDAASEDEGS